MGFQKAIELWLMGGIMLIILFNFLSVTVPMAQETIDNADAGVFSMGEASKLFLGLIGFVAAAGLLYAGLKEALAPDDRTRMDYYG